jgi:hypothetical protein
MRGDRQEVPPDVIERLEEMAQSDPDDYVRRRVEKFLREPWAQEREGNDA